jgi:hypothetical protein
MKSYSWILQMLSQSFDSMGEKKIFIRIFVLSVVILLLPLKDLTMLGKFRILLKYFKDLFLFVGIVMVITFVLTTKFLENLYQINEKCTVRTTFFKWFFSFWKGYFNYDEADCKELSMFKMQYIDKALQNILWIVLILKLIHTMETIVLPFVKGYMSKKDYPLLQLVSYMIYIGVFVYYVIKSETKMDDDLKDITKIAYNSMIIYTVLTFVVLIIDKLLILLSVSISFKTTVLPYEYVKNHVPVRLVKSSMVPNMKYIIPANLFVIIGVFFKKYYEIKTG